MSLRLNFQWKVLLFVACAMMAILFVSFYVQYRLAGVLVEDRIYNAAVKQTVSLSKRIATQNYFDNINDLRRDIQLVMSTRSDFKQIDVYRRTPNGLELAATTAPNAPRLETLTENSKDNALGEMDTSLPGVVSREDLIDNHVYWLITTRVGDIDGDGESDGYVSALVAKNVSGEFLHGLSRTHKFILGGTLVASVALLYFVFALFFQRPARDIVSAMSLARRGDLLARARVRRDDELGEIASGFNRLMDELSERERERDELLQQIRGFNDELKREVEEATRDLRSANEMLFQTQQRLARTERLAAVGQVAASLAHEIGTPLNAISGHMQLLARNHPHDADTQRRVEIVNKQLAFIVSIVKSLLERTHRRRAVSRPTDLNALVIELLRLVKPTLDTHKITTATTLERGLPLARADRDGVHQVLLNLVNNSIDAMPEGGRIEIKTRFDADASAVELIFRDTGDGIAPEALEHLFEPMWTTKATGNGFGLAIAREIMQEHGGRIEVIAPRENGASNGQARMGAAFRLTLPLADAGALGESKMGRRTSTVVVSSRAETVAVSPAARKEVS